MTRLWPAIPASLLLILSAGSVQAAPLHPELSTEPSTLIEKVHGTHRTCQYSSARGWHRHTGPYNRAVSCGYPYYYDDPFYYGPGFDFWFGPSYRYHTRPRYHRPYWPHRPYRRHDGRRR
jgi:hypothetical protein